MKKQIVIATMNFVNGGTERRAMVLANSFAEKGYSVTYLVINKIYDDVVYSLDERIKIVTVADYELSNPEMKLKAKRWANRRYYFINKKLRIYKLFHIINASLTREKKSLKSIISIRTFLQSHKEATYIAFGMWIFEMLYYASRGEKINLIFADVLSPQAIVTEKEKNLLINVQCKLLKHAKVCVFQTYDQKAYYEKYGKFKWTVIHNPLTRNLPQIYRGNRKDIVVNFCRTHPLKNLLLLVNAFYLLSKDYPNFMLYIYGATSTDVAKNYKIQVQKRIEELNLAEKAFIFDAISDVHERIKDCYMFVSSSDCEGLSNSMLEAMAIGLPCVCTDCLGGGAAEMIQDGENGLLVPPKDENALYLAMKRMIEEPGLAEKCGMNASLIREELSVEQIIGMWINEIEK